MAQTHEWMFYEVMWRGWAGRAQVPYPVRALRLPAHHDAGGRKVTVDITRTPRQVRYVYPCRFGPVRAVTADGRDLTVTGDDVHIPAGTRRFTVTYA